MQDTYQAKTNFNYSINQFNQMKDAIEKLDRLID